MATLRNALPTDALPTHALPTAAGSPVTTSPVPLPVTPTAHTPLMRLVLASNNAKKLAELRGLLGDLRLDLVPQGSLGIAEAEEPHITFI